MDLKEKIIHDSLRLFSLKGFLSTSIPDILEAANASRGGLYNYFKSKEDLFLMIMGHLYPEKTGFQKMIYDTSSGKVLGLHHVGYGTKESFPYLAHMMEDGLSVDQLGEMTELFMDSARFIQMARFASWERGGRREGS